MTSNMVGRDTKDYVEGRSRGISWTDTRGNHLERCKCKKLSEKVNYSSK